MSVGRQLPLFGQPGQSGPTGRCGPLGLRPAGDGDWPLITRWLGRSDIDDWWGPAASTEAEIRLALTQPASVCRVIEWDRVPIGYAQAVDATIWGEELPTGLETGSWCLDLFVGAVGQHGRPVSLAAAAMCEEVFATTLALAVAAFPSIANEGAVRAYERAGFQATRVLRDGRSTPSWFMVARRPRPGGT